jgi:cytochrome c oxidase subunit 2
VPTLQESEPQSHPQPTLAEPDLGSPPVRYWSALFALAALFAILAFAYSALNPDWWLPHNVSSIGREVDLLFLIILWITGLVFIGTQVVLVWESFRFADHPGRRADYFHGSQRLEVIWTIIPAAVLVFIALYQMGTWAEIKFRSAAPKVPPLAEVTARQFQWLIRYPGPDGKLHTPDDLHTINDLHFVKGKPALISLKTMDVLHSFFLPQMRIKQDAVPGLTIPVWFDAVEAGGYELVCAELCGWGHYKMRAKVTVHETQAEFDEWLRNLQREQSRSQLAAATTTEGK